MINGPESYSTALANIAGINRIAWIQGGMNGTTYIQMLGSRIMYIQNGLVGPWNPTTEQENSPSWADGPDKVPHP